MHIDARVIEVACIKSGVKFVLKGLQGCFGLNGLRSHLNDCLKQPTINTTMIEAVKHYMIRYFLKPLVAAGLKSHCPLVGQGLVNWLTKLWWDFTYFGHFNTTI